MKKILLYGHGGAYNHGAEAIVRSSIPVFRKAGCPILLSTHFPEQDREFGLDRLVDRLIPADLSLIPRERAAADLEGKIQAAREIYRDALAEIDEETICIGIGGDNYCYPNWYRQGIFHQRAKEVHGKSILWGCSIQPEMIESEMEDILCGHDRIYARESLTAAALQAHGAGQVILQRDPAFFLQPEEIPLPEGMGPRTAALNISPLILRRQGSLLQYFAEAVRLLLERVDSLLLLPHVTMPADDDRQALSSLARMLTPQERARLCLAPDTANAAQRKYLISRCAMLVCCRTHASIAGYSCGVPTLVVGYSVKSRGIGLDLGMEQWVIPWEKASDLPKRTVELWEARNEVHTLLRKVCKDDMELCVCDI